MGKQQKLFEEMTQAEKQQLLFEMQSTYALNPDQDVETWLKKFPELNNDEKLLNKALGYTIDLTESGLPKLDNLNSLYPEFFPKPKAKEMAEPIQPLSKIYPGEFKNYKLDENFEKHLEQTLNYNYKRFTKTDPEANNVSDKESADAIFYSIVADDIKDYVNDPNNYGSDYNFFTGDVEKGLREMRTHFKSTGLQTENFTKGFQTYERKYKNAAILNEANQWLDKKIPNKEAQDKYIAWNSYQTAKSYMTDNEKKVMEMNRQLLSIYKTKEYKAKDPETIKKAQELISDIRSITNEDQYMDLKTGKVTVKTEEDELVNYYIDQFNKQLGDKRNDWQRLHDIVKDRYKILNQYNLLLKDAYFFTNQFGVEKAVRVGSGEGYSTLESEKFLSLKNQRKQAIAQHQAAARMLYLNLERGGTERNALTILESSGKSLIGGSLPKVADAIFGDTDQERREALSQLVAEEGLKVSKETKEYFETTALEKWTNSLSGTLGVVGGLVTLNKVGAIAGIPKLLTSIKKTNKILGVLSEWAYADLQFQLMGAKPIEGAAFTAAQTAFASALNKIPALKKLSLYFWDELTNLQKVGKIGYELFKADISMTTAGEFSSLFKAGVDAIYENKDFMETFHEQYGNNLDEFTEKALLSLSINWVFGIFHILKEEAYQKYYDEYYKAYKNLESIAFNKDGSIKDAKAAEAYQVFDQIIKSVDLQTKEGKYDFRQEIERQKEFFRRSVNKTKEETTDKDGKPDLLEDSGTKPIKPEEYKYEKTPIAKHTIVTDVLRTGKKVEGKVRVGNEGAITFYTPRKSGGESTLKIMRQKDESGNYINLTDEEITKPVSLQLHEVTAENAKLLKAKIINEDGINYFKFPDSDKLYGPVIAAKINDRTIGFINVTDYREEARRLAIKRTIEARTKEELQKEKEKSQEQKSLVDIITDGKLELSIGESPPEDLSMDLSGPAIKMKFNEKSNVMRQMREDFEDEIFARDYEVDRTRKTGKRNDITYELKDQFDELTSNIENPYVKEMTSLLKPIIEKGNIKIAFTDGILEDNAGALFDQPTNTILLSTTGAALFQFQRAAEGNYMNTADTLNYMIAHEIPHTVLSHKTTNYLANEERKGEYEMFNDPADKPLFDKLDKIRLFLLEHPSFSEKDYGLQDIHELESEMSANPEFVKRLMETEIPEELRHESSNKTLFDSIWSIIKDVFKNIANKLGLNKTAYENILNIYSDLIKNAKPSDQTNFNEILKKENLRAEREELLKKNEAISNFNIQGPHLSNKVTLPDPFKNPEYYNKVFVKATQHILQNVKQSEKPRSLNDLKNRALLLMAEEWPQDYEKMKEIDRIWKVFIEGNSSFIQEIKDYLKYKTGDTDMIGSEFEDDLEIGFGRSSNQRSLDIQNKNRDLFNYLEDKEGVSNAENKIYELFHDPDFEGFEDEADFEKWQKKISEKGMDYEKIAKVLGDPSKFNFRKAVRLGLEYRSMTLMPAFEKMIGPSKDIIDFNANRTGKYDEYRLTLLNTIDNFKYKGIEGENGIKTLFSEYKEKHDKILWGNKRPKNPLLEAWKTELDFLERLTGIKANTWADYFNERNETDIYIQTPGGERKKLKGYSDYAQTINQYNEKGGYAIYREYLRGQNRTISFKERGESQLMKNLESKVFNKGLTGKNFVTALKDFFLKSNIKGIDPNLVKLATVSKEISNINKAYTSSGGNRTSSYELASQLMYDASKIHSDKKFESEFFKDNAIVQKYRLEKKPMEIHRLSGMKDTTEKKGVDPDQIDSNDIMISLLDSYMKGGNEYLQTLGQFGDKDKLYFANVPKYDALTAEKKYNDIYKKYKDWQINSPEKLKARIPAIIQLIKSNANFRAYAPVGKNEEFARGFVFNFSVNMFDLARIFHGKIDYKTYKDFYDLLKRAGTTNSSGRHFDLKIKGGIGPTLKHVFVQDPSYDIILDGKIKVKGAESTDGFEIIRQDILDRHLVSQGEDPKTLDVGSLKTQYSFVDENGEKWLIKSSRGVIENLGRNMNLPKSLYKDITDWMYKNDVEIITFLSSAKKLNHLITELFIPGASPKELQLIKNAKAYIKELDNSTLISQDDHRDTVIPKSRKQAKQFISNILNLPGAEGISELMNQRIEKRIKNITSALDIIYDDADSFKAFIIDNASDVNNPIYKLIETGSGIYNPITSTYQRRLLASMITKRLMENKSSRVQLVMKPDLIGLNAYEKAKDGKHTHAAQSAISLLNKDEDPVNGVRYDKKFGTKKGALEYASQLIDLLEISNDGYPTDKIKEWRIKEVNGEFIVPGQLYFGHRVPGSDCSSHPLLSATYQIANGNTIMVNNAIQNNAGEDNDVDSKLTDLFFKDKNGKEIIDDSIKGISNRILLIAINAYENIDNWDRINRGIDLKFVDPLVEKYKAKEEKNMITDPYSFINARKIGMARSNGISIIAKFNEIIAYVNRIGIPYIGPVIPFPSFKTSTELNYKQMKEFYRDPTGFMKSFLSNILNLSLDDTKNPKVELLGQNEVLTPFLLAAFVMNSDVYKSAKSPTELRKALEKHYFDISILFNHPIVKKYVAAVRATKAVGSSKSTYEVFSDIAKRIKVTPKMLEMLVQARKTYPNLEVIGPEMLFTDKMLFNVPPKIDSWNDEIDVMRTIKLLSNISRDLSTIGNYISFNHTVSGEIKDLANAIGLYNKIDQNLMKYIDISNAKNHPLLSPAKISIYLSQEYVHRESVELSNTSTRLQNIFEKLKLDVSKFNKTTLSSDEVAELLSVTPVINTIEAFDKEISNTDETPEDNTLKYKGGFENIGKGTPEGDGKDKAMRKEANGAIVELADNSPSSSRTTIETVHKFKTEKELGGPSTIVMLARNGKLKGQPLKEETKKNILTAKEEGMSFVVGDMPEVDSQFIDYLQEIGADFTIYHTGDKPRIQLKKKKVTSNKLTFKPLTNKIIERLDGEIREQFSDNSFVNSLQINTARDEINIINEYRRINLSPTQLDEIRKSADQLPKNFLDQLTLYLLYRYKGLKSSTFDGSFASLLGYKQNARIEELSKKNYEKWKEGEHSIARLKWYAEWIRKTNPELTFSNNKQTIKKQAFDLFKPYSVDTSLHIDDLIAIAQAETPELAKNILVEGGYDVDKTRDELLKYSKSKGLENLTVRGIARTILKEEVEKIYYVEDSKNKLEIGPNDYPKWDEKRKEYYFEKNNLKISLEQFIGKNIETVGQLEDALRMIDNIKVRQILPDWIQKQFGDNLESPDYKQFIQNVIDNAPAGTPSRLFLKHLDKHLKENPIDAFKIVIDPFFVGKDINAWGYYDSATNTIHFNAQLLKEFESNFHQYSAHELGHVLTVIPFDKPAAKRNTNEQKFVDEITQIYEEAKKATKDETQYGFKEPKDFISEFMSNPDFVKELKQQKTNWFARIWDAIRRFFGMGSTLYDRTMRAMKEFHNNLSSINRNDIRTSSKSKIIMNWKEFRLTSEDEYVRNTPENEDMTDFDNEFREDIYHDQRRLFSKIKKSPIDLTERTKIEIQKLNKERKEIIKQGKKNENGIYVDPDGNEVRSIRILKSDRDFLDEKRVIEENQKFVGGFTSQLIKHIPKIINSVMIHSDLELFWKESALEPYMTKNAYKSLLEEIGRFAHTLDGQIKTNVLVADTKYRLIDNIPILVTNRPGKPPLIIQIRNYGDTIFYPDGTMMKNINDGEDVYTRTSYKYRNPLSKYKHSFSHEDKLHLNLSKSNLEDPNAEIAMLGIYVTYDLNRKRVTKASLLPLIYHETTPEDKDRVLRLLRSNKTTIDYLHSNLRKIKNNVEFFDKIDPNYVVNVKRAIFEISRMIDGPIDGIEFNTFLQLMRDFSIDIKHNLMDNLGHSIYDIENKMTAEELIVFSEDYVEKGETSEYLTGYKNIDQYNSRLPYKISDFNELKKRYAFYKNSLKEAKAIYAEIKDFNGLKELSVNKEKLIEFLRKTESLDQLASNPLYQYLIKSIFQLDFFEQLKSEFEDGYIGPRNATLILYDMAKGVNITPDFAFRPHKLKFLHSAFILDHQIGQEHRFMGNFIDMLNKTKHRIQNISDSHAKILERFRKEKLKFDNITIFDKNTNITRFVTPDEIIGDQSYTEIERRFINYYYKFNKEYNSDYIEGQYLQLPVFYREFEESLMKMRHPFALRIHRLLKPKPWDNIEVPSHGTMNVRDTAIPWKLWELKMQFDWDRFKDLTKKQQLGILKRFEEYEKIAKSKYMEPENRKVLPILGMHPVKYQAKNHFTSLNIHMKSLIHRHEIATVIPWGEVVAMHYNAEKTIAGEYMNKKLSRDVYLRNIDPAKGLANTTNALVRYTATIGMALNLKSQMFTNRPVGFIMNITNHPELVLKSYGVIAQALVSKEGFLKVIRKIGVILRELKIGITYQDAEFDSLSKAYTNMESIIMLPVRITELRNQSELAMAFITKKELGDYNDKGVLIPGKEGISPYKARMIKDLVERVHGYYGLSRPLYSAYSIPRLAFVFKAGWMQAIFVNYLEKEKVDMNGIRTHGHLPAVISGMKQLTIGEDGKKIPWSRLSKNKKRSFWALLSLGTITLGIYAIILNLRKKDEEIMYGMRDADKNLIVDDEGKIVLKQNKSNITELSREDYKRHKSIQLFTNRMNQIPQDVTAPYSPAFYYQNIKDPFAVVRSIENAWKAANYVYLSMINDERAYYTESGIGWQAGENKSWNALLKITPVANNFYDWRVLFRWIYAKEWEEKNKSKENRANIIYNQSVREETTRWFNRNEEDQDITLEEWMLARLNNTIKINTRDDIVSKTDKEVKEISPLDIETAKGLEVLKDSKKDYLEDINRIYDSIQAEINTNIEKYNK